VPAAHHAPHQHDPPRRRSRASDRPCRGRAQGDRGAAAARPIIAIAAAAAAPCTSGGIAGANGKNGPARRRARRVARPACRSAHVRRPCASAATNGERR
jgi:hypothetical protein